MKNTFKKDKNISLKRLRKSFYYAMCGIKEAYYDEENLIIHTIMSIIVVILGFVLKVSTIEWLFLVLAIGFVYVSEIFNSAIERTVDCTGLEITTNAKYAKDIAAGAVLSASFISLIIGCIIFIPKIMELF